MCCGFDVPDRKLKFCVELLIPSHQVECKFWRKFFVLASKFKVIYKRR